MALQYDPEKAVASLKRKDKTLAKLMRQVGPYTLAQRDTRSPFHSLFRAIVYQQLSGKAAATIHQRVVELFDGKKHFTPKNLLALSDEELRAAGLSRAKTLAAKDLALKTQQGLVPSLSKLQTMADEEIIERLINVRGIGRWTVEMLLLFHLGRPDVLPVADLGVRKGFMQTYGLDELPDAKRLQVHAEAWRPYRSVASWYMWRAVDIQYLPS